MDLIALYDELLEEHGKQGWWPLLKEGNFVYDGKSPEGNEVFEVIAGCILMQNTQFDPNVTKTLRQLREEGVLTPHSMVKADDETIRDLIKSSGYYNQKTSYLNSISTFLLNEETLPPSRSDLLNVKGVGKETCDTILLYAFEQPEFVIDTYTERVLEDRGREPKSYNKLKSMFEHVLDDVEMYKEFHALLVEEGKSL